MPITPAGLAALNGSSSGDNGDNGSGLGSPAEHRLQPLFIDMRSLPEYEKSHINQAINVNLPTLLIKRYRRGAVSNFSLENFISTPEGKDNNEASIVVYDEYMHEADKSSFAWTLVGVLEKSKGQIYWLEGGYAAFRQWSETSRSATTLSNPPVSTTNVQRRASLFSLDTSNVPTPESEYSFVVSEIVPGFLYLGPEITTPDQMARLAGRSIRRILNMAEECDDDVPGLKERFVYTKIAARDTVEMRNVDSTLRMAVHVIDSAKDHHEPIYVHCKAGKSRSAAAILAYLVLSEQWTLKRAYRHLIKSRPTVSPNIGFVAELMKLEESVHGQVSNFAGTDWHLIDTTHPPSPDSQREIGKLQKAWREQSNRSK
ncbi:protein-tyrosine phosphatase-like protein [Phycomyces blakesleeanus]|uniref:protein-tyrosine-phosphatase n=1 Tax=Phycomyces blakesleeanus TaxID=4837 RepID=A0ABR3BD17_PHYBL